MTDRLIYSLIAISGALLFIPFLGSVHLFDWDEINFAESAREMILTGDYFRARINYEPFWEKPPLFFWLQVVSMKIFGINEFAARFPNALTGIASLLIIYLVGKNFWEKKYALLWVIAYAGSILPHFYFKTGIIDPLFNLFIFSAICCLYSAFEPKDNKKQLLYLFYAGILCGLAILTKGPVALLISGLTGLIFLFFNKLFNLKHVLRLGLFVVFTLLVAGVWFGIETIKNGTWFLQTFIEYNIRLFRTEDSGHGQPIYYHPVVLLIGCFPASIFALSSLNRIRNFESKPESFSLWMQILFWLVLVIFSISKTKIVHYSSLCYFPLTFLAVFSIYRWEKQQKNIPGFILTLLIIIGIIIAAIASAVPVVVLNKELLLPYIKDNFAKANLQAVVQWGGFEFLIGFILFAGLIGFLIYQKQVYKSAIILFVSTCLLLQLIFYLIIPKVEIYVQGAMIDFFKSVQNEDVYVKAIGFKSFAQYYYTARKPGYNKKAEDENWLIYGDIDKPVYIITKSDRDYYRLIPDLKVVMDKNGFVVYRREVRSEK